MAITAADVKKLRDATGAGMMDAKKALTECDGDFEAATELLRVKGAAKAAKRADREASNGLVASSGHAIIKLASETDFVAKNREFIELANQIVAAVDANKVTTVDAALELVLPSGETVADAIQTMVAKIGEKLGLAEVAYFDGQVEVYLHRRSQDLPPQVGVMLEYTGDDKDFVHSAALQIASMAAEYVKASDVPEDVLDRERRIAAEIAKEEGKPEKIIPKIVEGRLNSYFKDFVLLNQASVADEKKTVGQLAEAAGVEIIRFVRFSAGA